MSTPLLKLLVSRVQLYETPWTIALQAPLSMEFSSKNTGLGSHCLLQGIFSDQGLNPSLLHSRQILYHLSHQGEPLLKFISLDPLDLFRSKGPPGRAITEVHLFRSFRISLDPFQGSLPKMSSCSVMA